MTFFQGPPAAATKYPCSRLLGPARAGWTMHRPRPCSKSHPATAPTAGRTGTIVHRKVDQLAQGLGAVDEKTEQL